MKVNYVFDSWVRCESFFSDVVTARLTIVTSWAKARFFKNFNTKLPAAVLVGEKWRVNKSVHWILLVERFGFFLPIGPTFYKAPVQVSWQINK